MEALLGVIFVIVIVVVVFIKAIPLFIWLFGVILWLGHIGLLSLAICGPAVTIALLFLYTDVLMTVHCLKRKDDVGEIVDVGFDGETLWSCVDETLAKQYGHTQMKVFVSAELAVAGLVCMTSLLHRTGMLRLHFHDTPISEETTLISIALVSVAGLLIAEAKSRAAAGSNRLSLARAYEGWFLHRIRKLIARTEAKIGGATRLLHLQRSVDSLAGDMGIALPLNAKEEIEDFVTNHKTELLRDPRVLQRFIEGKASAIMDVQAQLAKAKSAHEAALGVFDDVLRDVNATGSVALIRELEQDYEGLMSSTLLSLLAESKWAEFHDVVASIVTDITDLARRAKDYSSKVTDGQSVEAETDTERACRILGVPKGTPADQLKKVYRSLVSVWHPDKGVVRDDGRIKEINWAYEYLTDGNDSQ